MNPGRVCCIVLLIGMLRITGIVQSTCVPLLPPLGSSTALALASATAPLLDNPCPAPFVLAFLLFLQARGWTDVKDPQVTKEGGGATLY